MVFGFESYPVDKSSDHFSFHTAAPQPNARTKYIIIIIITNILFITSSDELECIMEI